MTKLTNVSGLGTDVEYGLNGPRIKKVGSDLELLRNDDSLATFRIADGTASDHAVSVAQLEAVKARTGDYQSYSFDASSALSQLSGQGSGASGAILYGDKFVIGTAGTFIGQSADVDEVIVAMKENPKIDGTETLGVDWILVKIKVADELDDGVTLEAVGGVLQIKARGVQGSHMALATILEENMAANSVNTDQYVDRSVEGVHVKLGTLLDENHALGTIAKDKLVAAVQTTLTNADNLTDTEIPNLESAFGGSLNFATDDALAAHSNIMTNTTLIGKLDQAEVELVRIVADSAARKENVTYNGGASQNIGAQVPAGRDATTVYITPSNTANIGDLELEIQTSTGTVIVPKASIDVTQDGEVQVYPVSFNCAVATQFVAVVTSSTATSGSFRVMIEHI